jgi:hypothetical protein
MIFGVYIYIYTLDNDMYTHHCVNIKCGYMDIDN